MRTAMTNMPVDSQSRSVSPVAERDLAKLRETVGQVVGAMSFGAMLKQMRNSPLKGEIGHGGRGEEVFSAQLHQELAERAGTRQDGGLADAVFHRLEKQQRLISEKRFEMATARLDAPAETIRSVNDVA